jgi:hypothetical protein
LTDADTPLSAALTSHRRLAATTSYDSLLDGRGRHVVFNRDRYAPGSVDGDRLLAHELTHVIQQGGMQPDPTGRIPIGPPADRLERAADRSAVSTSGSHDRSAGPVVQRQLFTPQGPGGGFGGLMERDRQAARALAATPFHVCSRPLQIGGTFFNHAYIEAPGKKYAVISPRCTPTDGGPDGLIRGTAISKWDNSPDPCGQSPVNRVPCDPVRGVTDVGACLQSAYAAYASPSLYKIQGPNSNTFAGTLARACCAGMNPAPDRLGTMPGWYDAPASPRAAACGPKPTC